MKNRLLTLLLGVLVFVGLQAQPAFVNLTPRPKSLSVQSGKLVLPSQFTVSTVGLDVLMKAEVDRFAAELTAVTNCEVTVAEDAAQALFEISLLPANSPLKESGYSLSVKEDKITLKAKSYLGLYYGLQTVKKVLPANVMAGVVDQKVKSYALPLITVNDEPRYDYRGFMLDVSRHFFTVEEVKRMLDVMAYYKMNRFHWHLSDDQGWRVEIKKYPRLTTVGATAPNSQFTDMDERSQYMINRPYGPYFYTQEQIKDVVAYARERHIEVIPEIDMPGHFVAAMVAYPEYSCSPDAGRSVWDHGGVSSDVLNVGNPEAVRFAKDILSELMELFPYEVIHIGGDECPTSAWENNDLCRQRVAELGLTSYRQLQSHFIKELAEFVAEKGHRLAVWNEAITANGSDLDIMKSTGADIYCWSPARAAAQKAKSLGLPNIYTVQGAYYINRRQGNSELDPPGAGPGTDDVRATYNEVPPAETDLGVQGTFWCEHVSDRDYLEWLALPRLIAVAEAGWTQQSGKNFADFQTNVGRHDIAQLWRLSLLQVSYVDGRRRGRYARNGATRGQ